ncbi:cytochrome P450 [Allokutzneria oryzae]|uniref:Cytochrome P450 n=1 Tax=Allokutzneria oryzae TaxID=1378989 RepID=A0ABV6A7C5_9PSEU
MTAVLADHGLLRAWRSAATESGLAKLYDRLRLRGPVIATPWNSVLVTSHAACRDVLADTGVWRNPDDEDFRQHIGDEAAKPARHGVNQTLFHLNGADHTAQRRRLAPFFSPRALAAHTTTVQGVVGTAAERFVDHVAYTGGGDAIADFVAPVAGTVMCALLGVSEQDHEFITRMATDLSFVEELAPRPSHARRADAAITELFTYGRKLIQDRAYTPGRGLIAYLLDHPDSSGRDATKEVITALVLMITAGVSTSMSLMSSTVLALCRNPDVGHDDTAFVDECLRWDPPAHMVGRIATQDTVLAGTPIARGTLAHVLIGAANRDPDVFADPHAFVPGRAQSRSLTFSAGPHYCLGAGLARQQAVHLVAAWRQQAGGLAVEGHDHPRMKGPNFRHLLHLPVTTGPR